MTIFSGGTAAVIGAGLIAAGVGHFAATYNEFKQTGDWGAASKNSGVFFNISFKTDWGYGDSKEKQNGIAQNEPVVKPKTIDDEKEGFGKGFVSGFSGGVSNTVDFFKSLGTADGWYSLGEGFVDIANISCQYCPQGAYMRSQIAERSTDYIQNVPNMSAYEIGYDLGFGIEKGLEIAITRRTMPLPKALLEGARDVGNASKFTTIQSLSTYGKWGRLGERSFTWPNGMYTIDRATYYNRNYIIPGGRVIGTGQLQHLQKK